MAFLNPTADMSAIAPPAADAQPTNDSAESGSKIAARLIRGLDAISDGLVRARGGFDSDGNVMPAEVVGIAPRLGTWR